MTEIQLFNTLNNKKTQLIPINDKRVTMYVCGPTVYNRAHIGNARPAIVFDVLARLLRHKYGKEHVIYARNITDVDDKINAAAFDAGVDISVITKKYTDIYHQDMALLNVLPPDIEPTVTGHMGEIIEIISALIERNHAYKAVDGVYFHVPSMENYGRLSNRKQEDLRAGARVEIDDKKRDASDFALWKLAKPNEPFWPSPWGDGRPGWHIECSAMIEKNLGQTIDIHGGGHDLIFPHHENEIAQSECAHDGVNLANIWVHNGFLNFGTQKMSKSLGNVVDIEGICSKFAPEAVRMAMLSAHYRAPLDWGDEIINQSIKTLDRLYRALDGVWNDNQTPIVPQTIIDALSDDLNTPMALAAISELAKNANKATNEAEKAIALSHLLGAGNILGILQLNPKDWFNAKNDAPDDEFVQKIDELLLARTEARANKDWAKSDEIRAQLTALGVVVKDGANGATWEYI